MWKSHSFLQNQQQVQMTGLKKTTNLYNLHVKTLSKLRPQLYYKKLDIDKNDPTTWYKESGLIALEMYYDAPELWHLVDRGDNQLDEEGNSITTSINPQQDPDYSSWGKGPAPINYIGLISYLAKANTELHERVKASYVIEIEMQTIYSD